MCPFAPPLRRKVGRCGGRLCAGGGGGLQLFPPSFPPFLSQAVSRDCLCLCQQLGFSDQKPGPALLPASKHMPLKAASFSPGPGTSLLDICYRLWPCLGHDVEDPRKEILLPSAWLHVGGEGWFGDQLGRIHGCQWDLLVQGFAHSAAHGPPGLGTE